MRQPTIWKVTDEHVVLVEPTSPQGYRDWQLSLVGGIEGVWSGFRAQMVSPEEELESLLALMLPGDELWLATSRVLGPFIGNRGVAIVRNGKPVWYRIGVHY